MSNFANTFFICKYNLCKKCATYIKTQFVYNLILMYLKSSNKMFRNQSLLQSLYVYMQRLFDLNILKRIPIDWARIFQLQSSLASAESHMRERETDYILRIEYERPKVGGGISVAWTCICIFSVTHRFARHVFYSRHSLKRYIHDLTFSSLWKLFKIPTFIHAIVTW